MASAALTPITGLPTDFLPFGYAFADQTGADFAGTKFDTLYFTDGAEGGGAVRKYRFDGTTWAEAGSAPLDGALGLVTRGTVRRVLGDADVDLPGR